MTTSEKLLQDCEEHIAHLRKIQELIALQRALLDRFDTGSSVGTGSCDHALFLHEPACTPEQLKMLCRAIGGTWHRDFSSSGKVLWKNSGGVTSAYVFGAEPQTAPQALEL